MRRRLWQLFVLLLAVVLAGCSPDSGGTSESSPSVPTPSVTVSVSQTPDRDALFVEAERVYRAMTAARAKYELTGDYSEFPPEFAELLSPDYLAVVREVFDRGQQEGWVIVRGYPEPTVGPLPGVSMDGSEIAILTCFDSRGMVVRDASGVESTGDQVFVGTYYFKHFDGVLKIFAADGYEGNQCPIL